MKDFDLDFYSKGKKVNIKLEQNIEIKMLDKSSLKKDIFIEIFDSIDNKISQGKISRLKKLIWDRYDDYTEKSITGIDIYEYNNTLYVLEILNERIVSITSYGKVFEWNYFDRELNIIKTETN